MYYLKEYITNPNLSIFYSGLKVQSSKLKVQGLEFIKYSLFSVNITLDNCTILTQSFIILTTIQKHANRIPF